jgi:hypothetical protein
MNWLAWLHQFTRGSRAAPRPIELAVIPVPVSATAEVSRHDRGIIDHSRHVSSIGRR